MSKVAPRVAPKPVAKHAPAKAAHGRSATPKAAAHDAAPARKSSRRRRSRSGSPYASSTQLTSQPTHRAAYAETRSWLIEQHGAICAYCGRTFAPGVMTLDHVTPRRGKTAYDRRDNLVLACTECNAAKRDLSPIAFLLARRSRASHLLRYGSHLSPMLIDLARSLVPAEELERIAQGREELDSLDDYDGGSPYRD